MRVFLFLLFSPLVAQAGSWQCELKGATGTATTIFAATDSEGKLEPQAKVVMLGLSQYLPLVQQPTKEGEVLSAVISPNDIRTRMSWRVLLPKREDGTYRGMARMNAGLLPRDMSGNCTLW